VPALANAAAWRVLRRAMSFFLAAAVVLLAVTGLLLAFQRQLIYFPQRQLDLLPADLGLRSEEAILDAEGVRVHAWWLPADGARLTVLMCHGNGGNISHRLDRAARIQQQLGASVLLFDYRGYGKSEGRTDEEGTYRDARAAYRFLVATKGVDPAALVLFGESLGAAVAVQLAIEQPARALVLESPFTSIPDMARAAYPFLPPAGPLLRTRYDTLSKVPRLRMPLLVLHGETDGIVPITQARRVFGAAPEPKRFWAIPGADHNDTYLVGGAPYWQVWREFLSGAARG
jgi:uncharacterized protein